MVDLEPTVVDEVGLEYKTCFQNFTFSCVTTFFSVAAENGYLWSHFHFHTFSGENWYLSPTLPSKPADHRQRGDQCEKFHLI